MSIFKPEDALHINYVSDLNFEDFFLDGNAGTVYFVNDTAAFSGDWDRGNCKWTGCTFSGELARDAYFTNKSLGEFKLCKRASHARQMHSEH
ncbi:MAG: hypothetical protein NC247_07965 [Ruminococcus flavefaciens]|nr:hypothetical protein [Ruminococcus flavefaciens]MCM1362676.1 hypothetical protein [Clostridiales bacterium]MCM1435896.1 hypothetical protein [Ruminococcus flavefaciens]